MTRSATSQSALPCLSMDHHGHKCVGLAVAAAGMSGSRWPRLPRSGLPGRREARAAEERISAVHGEVKGNADRAREATRQRFEEVSALCLRFSVATIHLSRPVTCCSLTSFLSSLHSCMRCSYQREAEVLSEVDAMEKGKDFGLAAQVSELQWRVEALGRAVQDLARLRAEASDAVVVVEGGALLRKREELEKEVGTDAVESSAVRVDVDVEGLKKAIAAVGKCRDRGGGVKVKKAEKSDRKGELTSVWKDFHFASRCPILGLSFCLYTNSCTLTHTPPSTLSRLESL